MTTPTFNFVEDYIEFIGGQRNANGKKLGLFDTVPCPINLARYDVSVITSLSAQTADLNNPYTDKQSALAVKIVDKYRRQLANLNPPIVVPEKLDNFRLGIRFIDRTKSVYIDNNQFIVRFPYDTKLIDLVKKLAKAGEGSVNFDNDHKVWKLGMTEYMLNWIMAVCPNHDFAIDESVRAMYEKMLSVEQSNYEIKLKLHDQNLIIENAAPGLLQYIDSLGGLTLDNLLRLVDASNVLGYTVDQTLVDELKKLHSTNFEFIVNRRTSCSKDKMSMDDILEYARQVNRLPIHVYENGLPKTNTEEIIYLNRGFGPEICPKLLVTTTSLMIGSKKQSWVTNAEKIIIIE